MADVKRIQKDLETLRDFSEPGGEGTTRFSYTPAFRAAADYLKAEMAACGLAVREDGVGNLWGLYPGGEPEAAHIISGSHLDTVRCSGYFDGQAGVVCALEAARMLRERQVRLRGGYEVLATAMEEGARFKNLGGSKFVMGVRTEEDLDTLKDDDGIPLRRALREYGLTGTLEGVCRREDPVRAFLEVHMEQGSRLERAGKELGVVQTIFGCRWFLITVEGTTAHPSVPLEERRDAAFAAARLVTRLEEAAAPYRRRAALTVGRMSLYPGQINAIASRAEFSLDFRSGEESCFEELDAVLEREMRRVEEEYRVTVRRELYTYTPPTRCSPEVSAALAGCAERLGCSFLPMDSGAGHDAMVFARHWPVGMLFLPSRGGLTHCPGEWTDYANVARGADVLYEAILQLDAQRP